MKKKLIFGIMGLLCLVVLTACGSNKLDGDYTTTIDLFFAETQNTLSFDGETVTEKQDGEITNEGTYSISDNELTIELGDYQITAELSEDKQSFIIKSSDVLGGMGTGLEYTKEKNEND